jgi:Ser/Thr protein kinase RdoA (MazF antagonist)
MLPSTLTHQIQKLYNLQEIFALEKVQLGFLSHNHVIKDSSDSKYFLKAYSLQDAARVKDVHKVYDFFAQHKIPVISPIPAITRNTFFTFQNMHYALFPLVRGITLHKQQLSDSALHNMGQMLANIHLLSKRKFPLISRRADRIDKDRFQQKFEAVYPLIRDIAKKTDFDNLALESLLLKHKLFLKNTITSKELNLPYDHLIHGDYQNLNLFFNQSHQVKYIFDLDKTELAPRSLELIRSMDYMCFNGDFENHNFRLAKIYLNAYQNIYPITLEGLHKALILYYLTKLQSVWIETEYYHTNNHRVAPLLPLQHKTITYLSHNLCDFFKNIARSSN